MVLVHNSTWRAAARLSAAVALGLALGTSAGHAQQLTDAQKNAMRSSCRSDYIANCMSVSPGGKEALECLEKNMAKLSPGCQQAVSAAMPKPPPPPAAAAAPPPPPAAPPPAAAATPPPAAPPPAKPRPAAAAPPPPAAPAPAARAAPPPRPAAAAPPPAAATAAIQEALRSNCRSDFRVLCRGVPRGGPDALVCLQRNLRVLSPACGRVVRMTLSAPPPGHTTAMAPAAPPPPAPVIQMGRIESLRLRERLEIIRACNQDQAALCNGIRPGHSRLIVCLASQPQALSPPCRRTLVQMLQ